MIEHIGQYKTIFDERLNTDLMNRVHDKPLLECILECWYSLEVMKGITILGWKYTDRESEININDYIFKRERGKKKDEKYDYKYIDDSRLGLLVVTIKLELDYRDIQDGEMKHEEKVIEKAMLIPLQDELGRYMLNGKMIYLIYQLVEKSTYTAPNAIILKSLMPFAIKRYKEEVETTTGQVFSVPRYTIELFKKDIDVMLIYAAAGGMDWALQFALEAPYVIMDFCESEDPTSLTDIYFRISNSLYLRVDKRMFDDFIYVRSIVGSIMYLSNSRMKMDALNDIEVWLKKLGDNNPDKGRGLLTRAARLLDNTTERILRLDDYHKHSVTTLTRWMCEEYNDLRFKDNMDLNNKRLRSSEIFSAMFTLSLSTRLNRLMSMGKKATMENYVEVFAFSGDILVQIINTSGIQRYNDVINDCDFFSKFKYTEPLWCIKTFLIAGNFHMRSGHVSFRRAG